jgi:hypothetical protein
VGWPMLTIHNVNKKYPETNKTSKGHLNQTWKNVRLTKPMDTCNTTSIHGKKKRDDHTTTYNVHKTMFTNQTVKFPIWSLWGNKYIMVMVEVNSNAILVKPV